VSEFWFSPMVIARFRPIDFAIFGLCQQPGVVVRAASARCVPGPIKNAGPFIFPGWPAFGEPRHRSSRSIRGDPCVSKEIIACVGCAVELSGICKPGATDCSKCPDHVRRLRPGQQSVEAFAENHGEIIGKGWAVSMKSTAILSI